MREYTGLKEAPISGYLGLGGGVTARAIPIGGGSEYFYLATTSNAGYNTGGWKGALGILPFGSDGDCYIFYEETHRGKTNIARIDKTGKVQWSRRVTLSTWADGTSGANDYFCEAVVSPYNSDNWAIIRTKETSTGGSFTTDGWLAHGAVNTSGTVQWGRQRAMPDQSSLSSGNSVTKLMHSNRWDQSTKKTLHSQSGTSSQAILDVGCATTANNWKNPWNGAKTKNTILMNFRASTGLVYGTTVARQTSDPSNYWDACCGGNVSGQVLYTGWSGGHFIAGRTYVYDAGPSILYPRYFKNQYPNSPWNINVEMVDAHSNMIMGRYTYPSSSKTACALLTINNWNNGSNSTPTSIRSDDHVYPIGFAKDSSGNMVYRLLWRKSNGNYLMVLQRGHSSNTDWTRTITINDGSEWNIQEKGGPITIKNDKMYFTINSTTKGYFVVLPWDSDGPETGTYGDLTISGAPSGWVGGGGGTGWGNNGTGKDPTGGYRLTATSVGTNYAPVDNPVSNIDSSYPTTDTTSINTETEDIG